ncbi:NAD(P)-dependent oxidoreductase [uncultured Desulfobacter sp.]|uniref:NAD-dependent epimerase/dehydratase family protein n=1 Tax=uncultured Desulfobacter sp. TaxID=240139 RepID=UPI002AAAD8A0|nr:NAD(P)-dependent oxidoreductase [uncultured Desulfobacter sp.]
MKSVVFGGAGFVGSHVADALSDAGHVVTIFDQTQSRYLREDQSFFQGDILDPVAVGKCVQNAEYVYNLAGIADLDDAGTVPIETVRQNVLGNAIILDCCVKASVLRYVYASTIYVYSEKGGFYRCSKQACEAYIEEFQRKFGLEFTILRYGTLYGPRSNEKNSIYRYLRQALFEGKIVVATNGIARREYIHVRDAARLSVDILNDKYSNSHVTLTGHQSIYFKDLLNMIKEILNGEVEILEPEEQMPNGNHYEMTPYSYLPKKGYKLASNLFIDLGQGLLEMLDEIDSNKDKK